MPASAAIDTAAVCNHQDVRGGALLLLVQRGQVDLDAPVARYWPEFAQNGKDEITVRVLLSHRAGLPSMDARPVTWEDLRDWTPITEILAAAAPEWPPGTAHGYHGVTIGHLIGEVVRRVSGTTLSGFFAREIGEPLGVECFVRVPDADLPRMATMVVPDAEEVMLGVGPTLLILDREPRKDQAAQIIHPAPPGQAIVAPPGHPQDHHNCSTVAPSCTEKQDKCRTLAMTLTGSGSAHPQR